MGIYYGFIELRAAKLAKVVEYLAADNDDEELKEPRGRARIFLDKPYGFVSLWLEAKSEVPWVRAAAIGLMAPSTAAGGEVGWWAPNEVVATSAALNQVPIPEFEAKGRAYFLESARARSGSPAPTEPARNELTAIEQESLAIAVRELSRVIAFFARAAKRGSGVVRLIS